MERGRVPQFIPLPTEGTTKIMAERRPCWGSYKDLRLWLMMIIIQN